MQVLLILAILFRQARWVETISHDGNFRVAAPYLMKHRELTKETPVGLLTYHTLFCEDKPDAENQLYLVSWVDYPEGSIHSDSATLVEEFLNATVETAVLNVDGELMYQAPEKIQGFPGRYWRIDYNKGNAVVKTKAFIAGRRFYTLQVASLKTKNLNRAVDVFFDSFKLLSSP